STLKRNQFPCAKTEFSTVKVRSLLPALLLAAPKTSNTILVTLLYPLAVLTMGLNVTIADLTPLVVYILILGSIADGIFLVLMSLYLEISMSCRFCETMRTWFPWMLLMSIFGSMILQLKYSV